LKKPKTNAKKWNGKNKNQISKIQKTQKQNKRGKTGGKSQKGKNKMTCPFDVFCIYVVFSICFFACILLFAWKKAKHMQIKEEKKSKSKKQNI
jgi:hypothetical protein